VLKTTEGFGAGSILRPSRESYAPISFNRTVLRVGLKRQVTERKFAEIEAKSSFRPLLLGFVQAFGTPFLIRTNEKQTICI
jgi:hypothetical protein